MLVRFTGAFAGLPPPVLFFLNVRIAAVGATVLLNAKSNPLPGAVPLILPMIRSPLVIIPCRLIHVVNVKLAMEAFSLFVPVNATA